MCRARRARARHGGLSGHDCHVVDPRVQGHQTLMVQAAIAAEEECKSIMHTGEGHASMNLEYDSAPHSLRGYDPRSALDGLLPVHPLVLDEVPATLRASTLILKSPRRRCPPAANPRSGQGGWSGRDGPTPSGGPSHPSRLPRIHSPSHSRHASRRLFRMPIRAAPAASRLPRRHEAPGSTQSLGQRPFSSLRRDTPEGHPRGTL